MATTETSPPIGGLLDELGAGEAFALPAAGPLPLQDAQTTWVVTQGSVQVFARPRGDAPAARTPLFAVETGGLLMAPPDESPIQLIAVGIAPGTRVRTVPIARLAAAAAGRSLVVAGLVEDWLDELSAALRRSLPDQGRSLTAGETVDVGLGDAAWPATGQVWVTAAGGELGLHDLRPRRTDGELVLPIPSQSWVRAYAELRLTPIRPVDALAQASAWAGIAAFHLAVLAGLREELDRGAQANAERAERRREHERRLRAATYADIASILGEAPTATARAHGHDELLAVVGLVGAATGIEIQPPPRGAHGDGDPLETIARASGVRSRRQRLEHEWWRSDVAPFVGTLIESGAPVAVLRARRRDAYEIVGADGTRTRVTATTARGLAPHAHVLYRALPSHSLRGRDLLRFAARPLRGELVWLGVTAIISAGIALVPPIITDYLFSEVVPGHQRGSLAWMAGLLIASALASLGFVLAQEYAILRIRGRMSSELQAAIWDRVLDLPIPFFRRYSTGSVTQRVQALERIEEHLAEPVIGALLSLPAGISSLVYAFILDVRLGLFGLAAIVVITAVVVLLVRLQMPHQWATIGQTSRVFQTSIELINGVNKIRVADAGERAFAVWGERFAVLKRRYFRAQRSFAGITAIIAGAPAIGTLFLLLGASTLALGDLSGGTFLAFNTAFIQAMAIFTAMAAVGTSIAAAAPMYRELRPVIEEVRERAAVQEHPGELRGEVEVDHVTFRYAAGGPAVLDDIGFSAEPGEFVALVGPSGAGKSSILRVLLGFEAPEVGSVRYDGKDAGTLDRFALRQQIGVVVQSAKVMPGDILTNIIGARPLSVDDAWAAARIAGIADDIDAMPMGMHTIVGDAGGGFSGGQRQRLLIARAVAGHPRILLFDEATSALDGRTQAAVSEAIERLRATRIVIAHRLSTIRSADKIIVLDRGRIVQQGDYDELMATDGAFRRLALRQIA